MAITPDHHNSILRTSRLVFMKQYVHVHVLFEDMGWRFIIVPALTKVNCKSRVAC